MIPPAVLTVRNVGVAIAAFAALLAILLGVRAIYTHGHDAGLAEGRLELQGAIAQAESRRAEAWRKLAETQATMRQIELDFERRMSQLLASARAQVQTVEKVIRENPDFASVARPGELVRVRDEQLSAIAEAARRSAELSAAGLRTVRAPGPDDGQEARRD